MADTARGDDAGAPLDEVMLAMDVVDTLRHREHVVDRELNEEVREAELLARLKEIYVAQGIDVPDRILKEGVEALKRSRFTYEPPPGGFQTKLARLYVARWRWGKVAAVAVAALVIIWAVNLFVVRLPAERAAEAARVELAETIPSRLNALNIEIQMVSKVAEASDRAEMLRAEGIAAAAAGDRDKALAAERGLEALRDALTRQYDVRIVQEPDMQSGIWRIPDVNDNARNYYLIVEAVTEDGARLTVPVRSEETGEIKGVTRWGQRVSEAAFDRIRRDKSDDGIIQSAVIGTKERGRLDPEYSFPVQSGAILEW